MSDDVTGEILCSTLRELGDVAFEKLVTEKEEEMERNKYLLVNMEKTRASLKVCLSDTTLKYRDPTRRLEN